MRLVKKQNPATWGNKMVGKGDMETRKLSAARHDKDGRNYEKEGKNESLLRGRTGKKEKRNGGDGGGGNICILSRGEMWRKAT